MYELLNARLNVDSLLEDISNYTVQSLNDLQNNFNKNIGSFI